MCITMQYITHRQEALGANCGLRLIKTSVSHSPQVGSWQSRAPVRGVSRFCSCLASVHVGRPQLCLHFTNPLFLLCVSPSLLRWDEMRWEDRRHESDRTVFESAGCLLHDARCSTSTRKMWKKHFCLAVPPRPVPSLLLSPPSLTCDDQAVVLLCCLSWAEAEVRLLLRSPPHKWNRNSWHFGRMKFKESVQPNDKI